MTNESMEIQMTGWNLDTAIPVAQLLEPIAVKHGYHIGLNGSVLYRGSSNNDLDLIVYRHHYPKADNHIWNRDAFIEDCVKAGFSDFEDCGAQYDAERKDMVEISSDARDVFQCYFAGNLVNFFFFNV